MAWCTIQRFTAGSYAIKMVDIHHFFNQCNGSGEGTDSNSFHEAPAQVIWAELNTSTKTHGGKRKDGNCAIVRPHGRLFIVAVLMVFADAHLRALSSL